MHGIIAMPASNTEWVARIYSMCANADRAQAGAVMAELQQLLDEWLVEGSGSPSLPVQPASVGSGAAASKQRIHSLEASGRNARAED